MPNLTATLSYAFVDEDANSLHSPPLITQCPYAVVLDSSIPIPDGTASGTEIDIPFTGIQAATFVYVKNMSGQELNAAWLGNWGLHLPDCGCLCYILPAVPSGGVIPSLRFMLTKAQVGAGKLHYVVAGI